MDPVVSKEKTISTGLPLPPVTVAGLESLAGGDSTLTFLAGEGFDFTSSSSSSVHKVNFKLNWRGYSYCYYP